MKEALIDRQFAVPTNDEAIKRLPEVLSDGRKTLAQWMHRAGLGEAPRAVLQEFARIKSGDVVLPARGRSGQLDNRIRLRCVTTPDAAQNVLLNRLGLTLPQRLRRIDEMVQM
jgi:hypothetical protein